MRGGGRPFASAVRVPGQGARWLLGAGVLLLLLGWPVPGVAQTTTCTETSPAVRMSLRKRPHPVLLSPLGAGAGAGRAWRPALAAVLLAFVALAGRPAHTQEIETFLLMRNTANRPFNSGFVNNQGLAQGVRTGSNRGGYTLTEVRLYHGGVDLANSSLSIRKHESVVESVKGRVRAPGGTEIATLQFQKTVPHSTTPLYYAAVYPAPANTVLDPATTYYVQFNRPPGRSPTLPLLYLLSPPHTSGNEWNLTGGLFYKHMDGLWLPITSDGQPRVVRWAFRGHRNGVTLEVNPAAVSEGAGSRTVTVTGELNEEPRSADTVVTLSVTAETATVETDFTVANITTLTILGGQTSGTATFTLTPVNDLMDEPDETVTVEGSTTVGLDVTETTLMITDNDNPPPVTLELSANPISEGETSQVTAKLSHPSSAATTVEVAATAVPAAGEDDFTLSGPRLTIEAGDTVSSGSATLTAEDNTEDEADKQVQVRGRAENPQGVQSPNVGPVPLTIQDDDAPVVTGADTPAYVEGGTGPVATYTASNPANVQLTWSVSGPDADAFTIVNGVLSFEPPPDFEEPTDDNADTVYEVTVQASDGTLTGELAVSVLVRDAVGRVRLSSQQPRVGRALTTTVVDDLDGVAPAPPTPDEWCWERSLLPTFPPAETTPADCTSTTTGTYTPVDTDLDHYLRVSVIYTDGQEMRKAMPVRATTDEPVVSVPSRPPQPPVSRGGGGGGSSASEPEPSPAPVGFLENPGADSFQSGIGVIAGWVCEADEVEIELNGARQGAAYGTERLDTESVCGDTDNGFGLLFNWNLLGDGEHEVVTFVDDVEFGRATVTVTTLGTEFLRDVTGECTAPDFPMVGETVTLMWQQTQQNFVIVDGERPRGVNRAGRAGVGYLENPSPNSFQSGIGVISGWVCEGDEVMIALNGVPQPAAYGTERLDTREECGDTDNGFGLLFNWNLLGEGAHTVEAFVDGEELGRATVRVTTVGEGAEEEFVRGVAGECTVEDFPTLAETVTLEWQQNSQNFVITDVE